MFRHTHSHLDNYVPSHLHSPDERGNILTDKVADNNCDWVGQRYPQLVMTTTTMRSVHSAFVTDIPLCVTDGSTPTLISLHNIFEAQNFDKYIAERMEKTQYSDFYQDAAYHFTVQVFQLDKADLCQRASCQRLILDKVWQP